ncbi:MAG: CHAP domain-containing protein [Terricaulis sp.]
MAKLGSIGPARAIGLGLVAVVLAGCASMPAPVVAASTAISAQAPFNPDAPPRVLPSSFRLQCVPYARNASGIEIFGDANTWWTQAAGRYPRSASPAAGSVLVMRGYNDPGRGHVAVVTEVVSPRIVRVDHANWLNNGEISVGVPVLDISPGNDWSEVRVWHVPGGHWGARTYQAQGFIHPFLLRAELGFLR